MTKPERHKLTLPRATILLLIVVLILFVFGVALTLSNRQQRASELRFEREIIGNCRLLNHAHVVFDETLDQLTRNARASTSLPPATKREALRVYASLHLPQQICPPQP